MTEDRAARVWAQIGQQSRGDPVSLAHVCAAAVAEVGVGGAAVTVTAGPDVRDTVHATNQEAGELEEWQMTFGQGPCVDAVTAGGPVLVVDLRAPDCATRWPVFTPAALGSGARAVFALPLQIGAIRLGVLDLHRTRPGPLTPHELADALAFADAAGTLLLDEAAGAPPGASDPAWHGGDGPRGDGQRDDGPCEDAWQRDDPTAHHAQVHQATGMILVQLGVSAETAFARLRAYAYAHDRRLGDAARDVIARRLRFEPDPPPAAIIEE